MTTNVNVLLNNKEVKYKIFETKIILNSIDNIIKFKSLFSIDYVSNEDP